MGKIPNDYCLEWNRELDSKKLSQFVGLCWYPPIHSPALWLLKELHEEFKKRSSGRKPGKKASSTSSMIPFYIDYIGNESDIEKLMNIYVKKDLPEKKAIQACRVLCRTTNQLRDCAINYCNGVVLHSSTVAAPLSSSTQGAGSSSSTVAAPLPSRTEGGGSSSSAAAAHLPSSTQGAGSSSSTVAAPLPSCTQGAGSSSSTAAVDIPVTSTECAALSDSAKRAATLKVKKFYEPHWEEINIERDTPSFQQKEGCYCIRRSNVGIIESLLAVELILYSILDRGNTKENMGSISNIYSDILDAAIIAFKAIYIALPQANPHSKYFEYVFMSRDRVNLSPIIHNTLVMLCVVADFVPGIVGADTTSVRNQLIDAKAILFRQQQQVFDVNNSQINNVYVDKLWSEFLKIVIMPLINKHPINNPKGVQEYKVTAPEMQMLICKLSMLTIGRVCVCFREFVTHMKLASASVLASSSEEFFGVVVDVIKDPSSSNLEKLKNKFRKLDNNQKIRLLSSFGWFVLRMHKVHPRFAECSTVSSADRWTLGCELKKHMLIQGRVMKLMQLFKFVDAGILMLAVALDSSELFEFLRDQIKRLCRVSAQIKVELNELKIIYDLVDAAGISFNLLHLVFIVGATNLLDYIIKDCTTKKLDLMFKRKEVVTGDGHVALTLLSSHGNKITCGESGYQQQPISFYRKLKGVLEQNPDLMRHVSQQKLCLFKAAALYGDARLFEIMMEMLFNTWVGAALTNTKPENKGTSRSANKEKFAFYPDPWSQAAKAEQIYLDDPRITHDKSKTLTFIRSLVLLQTIIQNRAFPVLFDLYVNSAKPNESIASIASIASRASIALDLLGEIFLTDASDFRPFNAERPLTHKSNAWFCGSGPYRDNARLKRDNLKELCTRLMKDLKQMKNHRQYLSQYSSMISQIEVFVQQSLLGLPINLSDLNPRRTLLRTDRVVVGADIQDYCETVYLLVRSLSEILVCLNERMILAKHVSLFFKFMRENNSWNLATGYSCRTRSIRKSLIKIALALLSALEGQDIPDNVIEKINFIERQVGFETILYYLVIGKKPRMPDVVPQGSGESENIVGSSGGSSSTQGSNALAASGINSENIGNYLVIFRRAFAEFPEPISIESLKNLRDMLGKRSLTYGMAARPNSFSKEVTRSIERILTEMGAGGVKSKCVKLRQGDTGIFSRLSRSQMTKLLPYLSVKESLALCSCQRVA